jgi:hypothetical protein
MRDLLSTAAVLLAAILIYGLRTPILAALKRFDSKNTARRLQEARDRSDHLAHFRHTLQLADEQVEQIGELTVADARTGAPVRLFVFEGERFLSRDDAEAARNEVVAAKARTFYQELPKALMQRGDGSISRK